MTTALLPLGIAALPDGATACARCGTATRGEAVTLDVHGRDRGNRLEESAGKVTFGLCETCRARDEYARTLVAAHPSVRRAIGSPAQHLVSGALDALALLGVEPPPNLTAQRLHDLLTLSTVGIRARWSSQFSPIWRDGVSTKQCAAEPWLFVSIEDRNEARQLRADWLADGLPPIAVTCPSGGCAWCGIHTTAARRSKARTLWLAHGRGHLCPTCADQHERGEDFHGAFLAFIDPDRAIRRRTPEPPNLNGVLKWQDAHGGDGTAWSHMGERDELRHHVAGLLGLTV
jgi:hypothetical protein